MRRLAVLLFAAGCSSAGVHEDDVGVDAQVADARSTLDAAPGDRGTLDQGSAPDVAAADADEVDAAGTDAASLDAGSSDAGSSDAEPSDAGATGNALHFDGIDDRVAIRGEPGGFRRDAFSEETWFRTRTSSGAMLELHSTVQTGADRTLYLRAGQVCFYVYSPTRSSRCTAARYDDGAWHHVAGTLGPAGQTLYVDGVLVSRTASITSSAFDWDNELQLGYGHIGADALLEHFGGELDEVRLWRVTRTATDVAASFRGAIDPASPGLIGYWRMEQSGTASVAQDSSPAVRSGRLEGFDFQPSPWVGGAF